MQRLATKLNAEFTEGGKNYGPYGLLSLSVLSHVFGAVHKTSSSFSAHGKIGNFIHSVLFYTVCGPKFMKFQRCARGLVCRDRGEAETFVCGAMPKVAAVASFFPIKLQLSPSC